MTDLGGLRPIKGHTVPGPGSAAVSAHASAQSKGTTVSKNATSHDFMSQELGAAAAAGTTSDQHCSVIDAGGETSLGRVSRSHKINVNLVLIAKFVAE